jgi:hypothetical protein
VRGGKVWFKQKNKNKNVRSSRRKFTFGGRSAAREADRERKRERVRRAKEVGPDAMRKCT